MNIEKLKMKLWDERKRLEKINEEKYAMLTTSQQAREDFCFSNGGLAIVEKVLRWCNE